MNEKTMSMLPILVKQYLNSWKSNALFQKMANDVEQRKNDIIPIFEKYDYHISEDWMYVFAFNSLFFGIKVFTPQEQIVSDLKFLHFLQQYDSCFLSSTETIEKIPLTSLQQADLQMLLKKKVYEDIDAYFELHGANSKPQEASIYGIAEWIDYFQKIPSPINREQQMDEIYYVGEIYNIAVYNNLFELQKNQKGTYSIKNKEASFMYDLLMYIKTGGTNSELSTKEKADYIRYRLKLLRRKSGEK